jgi:hypothetical protein
MTVNASMLLDFVDWEPPDASLHLSVRRLLII